MPITRSTDDDLPVTPAMRFVLLTGQHPPCRLSGWVCLAQQGKFGEPTLEMVWRQHAEALIDEAAAADFEPFWCHKRRPTGDSVARWQRAFLQQHRY